VHKVAHIQHYLVVFALLSCAYIQVTRHFKDMIDLKTLIILIFVFFLQLYILKILRNESYILTTSLLVIINVLFILILINSFQNITTTVNLSNITAIDKLVAFDSYSVRVRNSLVIMGLMVLSYGLYDQYILRKKKIILVSTFVMTTLTIVIFVLMIIAGGFII